MPKPKIIILLSRFPYPLEKGDKLRAFNQIKSLYEYFDIYLITLINFTIDEKDKLNVEKYCKRIFILYLNKGKSMLQASLALFSKEPFQVAFYYQKNIQLQINDIVNEVQPSIIYTQLARMAKYAFHFPIKKVLDFQDAFSCNYQRSAEQAKIPLNFIYKLEAKRMLCWEKKLLNSFDATTIISNADKNYIGNNNIVVVRNGVDSQFYKTNNNIEKKYDLVFVGNLGYMPNILAVEMIIKDIIPKLLSEFPTLKVLIAGANPTAQIKNSATENIEIEAWLPDIRDAYNSAKIFIAPLFSGAGLQNKLLEAMSLQMPCITTTICNNSLQAIPNEQIIIADSVLEFVNKIIYLLKNVELQNEIGKNAKLFITQNYDWESANKVLIELLLDKLNKV